MHGDYSLTHGIDDVSVMGDYQNGGSSVIDLLHQSHDLLGSLRIQVSGWLICQKDVRAVYQCSGKGNSLLLTTGKFIRICLIFPCKTYFLENLRNTFTDHAGRSSDNTLCKCYVLIYITVF